MSPPQRARGAAGAAGAAGSDATWIGKCLDGRYQIEQQLGAGGAGTVYRARHLGLNRPVAVKVLLRQHQLRQASRQRFEREAQALAQLSHEHVVAISDCGVAEDMPFLVMELLEGEGLDARLKRGKPPPELALQLMRELLLGLAYVHERGLVHRDIKPGNLFLEQRPSGVRLKLLDFGLAKLLDTGGERGLTMSGEVFGTPAYMPPEQITGEGIDARSDVYSAALVCFELFAGRRAYSGHEAELFRQHLVEPLPPLGVAAELAPLEALLQRATDKNKQQRFAHAGEMLAALDALELARPRALPRAAPPPRSSPARAPARPRARAARAGGGALRVGALVVCALALAAIVLAGGAIFLLGGPEGSARRSALKRALSSPSSETTPAPKAR